VLWEKGFVFDTSENESMSTYGGGYTAVPFQFEAPTGKGVESVTLPSSGDYTTATYYGIMPIVFEDATGWGASAYAEFDYTTRGFTKVVITSRGCDYSDSAKAYIESPDRSTRYECGLTLTSNEGKCGPLVKRGAPDLRLYSANTITGGIVVEQGTLRAGVSGVIPANTPVTVAHGATLDLNNAGGITVSTFAGAGTVSNGNVTVTNAVRATCADLFAGKAAAFSGDLTFADGAVFEITDAENLETYKNEKKTAAITAGGTISRQPELRLTTSTGASVPVAGGWTLRLAPDGKTLKFGRNRGMVFSLR
jgi:autotransporter-associated beta strand protein